MPIPLEYFGEEMEKKGGEGRCGVGDIEDGIEKNILALAHSTILCGKLKIKIK